MPRQPVLLAAASALALCAAACAETGKPSVSSQPSPGKATPAVQNTAQKSAPGPSASLETEIRRAQTLRAQGQVADAIRTLAQLVLVAPDDARVVGEYGKALVQQGGRSDDAVAFLKRGVQLKPGDWTLYSALGVAYDQSDDSKNAAAAYGRAMALHPGDAAILNNYAVSRMLAGDLNGAEKLLRQAQMAGGYNPKLTSNLALLAQMKTAKGPSASQAVNSASKPPQALAASPPTTAPGNMTVKPQTVTSASANATAVTSPVRTTVVMQPVPKEAQAAPVKTAGTPPQTLASAPANAKLVAQPPVRSMAMQSMSKQGATAPAKAANTPTQTVASAPVSTKPAAQPPSKPPQALASAPLNIKPAAPPSLPSTVVMQPVPKDAEAGPVKVAAKPARQPLAHPPAAAAGTRLAKSAPARPVQSSVPALRTADQGE